MLHSPFLDHFSLKRKDDPLDELCKAGPPPVHWVHGVETHVDTQAQQAESEPETLRGCHSLARPHHCPPTTVYTLACVFRVLSVIRSS